MCGNSGNDLSPENPLITHVVAHHAEISLIDDLLMKKQHKRMRQGHYIVPLPKKPDVNQLGESRYQAVRRFYSLERSLHRNGKFESVHSVIKEYIDLGQAEVVPAEDRNKDPKDICDRVRGKRPNRRFSFFLPEMPSTKFKYYLCII